MFEATVIEQFAAAHQLPDYPGKCSRMHGHTWKVEVTVGGTMLDQLGMLVDFHELKEAVHHVLEQLDHYTINDVIGDIPPTAEIVAKWISEQITKAWSWYRPIKLIRVRVWESDTACVDYYE